MRNDLGYKITDLDTKGLRKFVTGGILIIVAAALGSVPSSFGDGVSTAASFASIVLMIVSLVFQISGLSRMIQFSERFRSARRFLVISLVGSILIMIAGFAIAFGAAVNSLTANNMQALMFGGFGAVLAAELFAIIMNILEIRSLLFGCRDICTASAETAQAEKMEKTEKLYRIANIVTVVLIGVMLACLTMTDSAGALTSGEGLKQLLSSLSPAALVSLILVAVSAVVVFIINIMMLARVYGTAKILSGRAADGSKLGTDPKTGYKGKH
jgi:hypothetical protein